MMNPHDRALFLRDPALPGLRDLLDPDAFTRLLRKTWPDLPEGPVKPRYLRYKPGTNCLAAFELEASGETIPIHAKTHRTSDRVKFTHAESRPRAMSPYGKGRAILSRRGIVISLYPNDGKLKDLYTLATDVCRIRLLERLFPDHADVSRYRLSRLRYKPERRLVLRVHRPDTVDAVIKFFTRSAYPDTKRQAQIFGACSAFQPAPVIAHSDRHRLLAFPWMPGRLLSDDITGGVASTQSLQQVGAALAALHAQPGAGLICCDRDMDLARCRAMAHSLEWLDESLSKTAGAVLRRLETALAGTAPLLSPIHGDFYAKQILVDASRTSILDFDRSRLADPSTDVGTFIAHLERDHLRGRIDRAMMERSRDAFLAGYRYANRPMSEPQAALHTAAALFELSLHPFRFREPDWPDRIDALLRRCMELLAEADGAASYAPHVAGESRAIIEDPKGAHADPGLPCLAQALEPATMTAHFRRLLAPGASPNALHLRAARVRRHKRGRRCMIEYALVKRSSDGSHETVTLLGKIRAKGVDEDALVAYEALYHDGFSPKRGDGLSIPEPMGCLAPLGMWLQRKMPGVTATRLMASDDGPAVAARIGQALVKLHRTGVRPKRTHTLEDELDILRNRLPEVGRLHPRWAGRVAQIIAACERLAARIPEHPWCPIHRDFYADNVLVDGTHVYLLDFDLFCMGDPALDAGNFIGHLFEQGLRTPGQADLLNASIEAFEETFVSAHGEEIRRSVRAYTTLTLVRHIHLSTRFPERTRLTGPLLDLCEARLSPLRRTLVSPLPCPNGV